MREIFQRTEDNSLVSIEIDMNAFAYSSDNPWLFSIFIKFDAQNEEGEAYEEFLEAKEALIIALSFEDKAKYIGSRLTDGWSELYFYAQDSKNLDITLTKILKSNNYVYESSVVRDTKWDFHHKNLKPSELELCNIESEKIIEILKEENDDLSVVRPVEHYVSFTVPTQKNRFINTLKLEGYSIKDELSSEEFEHGLALVKEHNVQSSTVEEEVKNVFYAVKECQGFYEGWSTLLALEIEE